VLCAEQNAPAKVLLRALQRMETPEGVWKTACKLPKVEKEKE